MDELQTAHAERAGRVRDDGVANPVLHHVNLKTTRLSEMIDWYGTVVGMRPTFRGVEIAFLTNDAANHRVALTAVAGLVDDPDKVTHTGLHHSAFEFASLADLLTRYHTLAEVGILPEFCLDHGSNISFYYVDPDGNVVELQADTFGDWARSTELIRTSTEFAADPIGAPVDAAKLAAAAEQGLSAAELHERSYRGEYPPDRPQDLRLPTP